MTSRYQGYQAVVGAAFLPVPRQTTQRASRSTEFVDHWYRAVCRKLHGPGDATEERAVG